MSSGDDATGWRLPALRLVPSEPVRPSVVVEDPEDYFRLEFDPDDPSLLFSDAELGGVPRPIFRALYVGAWASAELCPLYAEKGGLDLYRRYGPSPALWSSFTGSWAHVVGCLGWGIPVDLGSYRRGMGVFCAPPRSMGVVGTWGAN